MTFVTKFQIKIPKSPVASINPTRGIMKFALIFFRRTNPDREIIANNIKNIEQLEDTVAEKGLFDE